MNAPDRFGHPPGLAPLFFTELWERFSFYGMRGLLILFMTASVADGGLGFDTATAGAVYGLYSSLVYLACLPGGWLADRFLGSQRATLCGGWIILGGHLCMAWPSGGGFYPGLALLVLGTGLLKPSVSTMVGQLYADGDPRRDSGFSLYYMGINLGAFLAPLICGWVALAPPMRERLAASGLPPGSAWHWAFGCAALGMLFGLRTFLRGREHFAADSRAPAHPPQRADWRRLRQLAVVLAAVAVALGIGLQRGALDAARLSALFGIALLALIIIFFGWLLCAAQWSADERRNLRQIGLLFLGAVAFWSLFEQGSSTLTLFAERSTDRAVDWLGYEFPATWYHTLNPLLIIALAPVFAWGWWRLGPRNPSPAAKFTLGLLSVAAGFALLIPAAVLAGAGVRVSPWWLIGTYVLHTLGELCLSPVGLSAMTRLAPARIAGLTMGVWFLASSAGNYLGGRVASVYERFSLAELFATVAAIGIVAAVLLGLGLRRGSRSAPEH